MSAKIICVFNTVLLFSSFLLWGEETSTYPAYFSAAVKENMAWETTLPESGSSNVVVIADKLFFTYFKPVEQGTYLSKTIIACCAEAKTGEILWEREIVGTDAFQMNLAWGDPTSASVVGAGKQVIFLNGAGKIVCYDLNGSQLWERETLPGMNFQPFVYEDQLIYLKSEIHATIKPGKHIGKYSRDHYKKDKWFQLQSLDITDGSVRWTSSCGICHQCDSKMFLKADGTPCIAVGRGGGHIKDEKPYGISLLNLKTGKEHWRLDIANFGNFSTLYAYDNSIVYFQQGYHWRVNVETGEVENKLDPLKQVKVTTFKDGAYQATVVEDFIKRFPTEVAGKSKRFILGFKSNRVIGEYHYFRSYGINYLGRIHIPSGTCEYLQLPVQALRSPNQAEELLWGAHYDPKAKELYDDIPQTKMSIWVLRSNEMKNSRGIVVAPTDSRSWGNGWGHIRSRTPSIAGDKLYIPSMNGMVYVIKWDAKNLDGTSLLAVSDLGPAGSSWSRSELTLQDNKLYARTIKKIMCFESK